MAKKTAPKDGLELTNNGVKIMPYLKLKRL